MKMKLSVDDLRPAQNQFEYPLISEGYLASRLDFADFVFQSRKFVTSTSKSFIKNISPLHDSQIKYDQIIIQNNLYHNIDAIIIGFEHGSTGYFRVNPYQDTEEQYIQNHRSKIEAEDLEIGINIFCLKQDQSIETVTFLFTEQYKSKKTQTPQIDSDDPFIESTGSFLLQSVISQPERSPLLGSCYAIYDYENHCFRKPHWLWSDAPTVLALLQLNEKYGSNTVATAEGISKTLLTHQQSESQTHPGAHTSRYRKYGNPNYPFETLLGPNDTSFIARFSTIPMYTVTGKECYRDKAKAALDWVANIVQRSDFVSSHYYLERKAWENKAFVDTGFVPVGFAAYNSQIEYNELYEQVACSFMDKFISQFKITDGLYGHDYYPNKGVKDRIFTRGLGWVLAGLIATYEISQNEKYIDEAIEIARSLVQSQQNNGAWGYLLGYGKMEQRAQELTGCCEKATAIIAYYFLKLTGHGYSNLLAPAKRALRWCEQQIFWGDSPGYGGIKSSSLRSGITDLPFMPVSTGYANAYYILAKMLEKDILYGKD